jgi:hypothetical protein
MTTAFPILSRDLIPKFLAGLFFLSPLVSIAGIVQPIAPSIYYTGLTSPNAPLSCQGGVNRDTIGQACGQYLSNTLWQSIYTYIGYSGETNPFTYIFSHTSYGVATANYEIGGWVQSSCDKGGYSLSNNTWRSYSRKERRTHLQSLGRQSHPYRNRWQASNRNGF